jgi:hypothetical protein
VNKDKYEAALADIAAALVLVDKVGKIAYSTQGYTGTKRAYHCVVRELECLTESLSTDWEEDERDLDETLNYYEQVAAKRGGA